MAVTKVVMPKLSEAMETGKLIRWLKQEGDRISSGDIIAEIETDKADIELEAFGAGVLRKVLVTPGTSVPVGDLIGVIAEPGDDISELVGGAPSPAPAAPAAPSAPSRPGAPVRPAGGAGSVAAAEETPAAEVPPAVPARPATASPPPTVLPGGRLRVSPLARRLAQKAGVELAGLTGTGPGGRIIQRDVEAAIAVGGVRPAAVAGTPAAVAARPGPEAYEDQALSQIRAAIARQMIQSKAPVPHFYVTSELAMDRAVVLRAELQALPDAPKVTVTDLVVRAAVLALLRHPGVNASFQGNVIRRHRGVHMGIAVALEDGLITPVLRDCERKSLFQLAAEARDLVERTRARKLRAQELSGATFTVSNLGMFPVDEFSAIINPPEGAILAVGAIVDKAVVVDGQLAVGKRMRVTLSCDHRVMDGAMGARYLADLKALLEAPLGLLV
jgi:pyruvate dehydrogenase E2 component (dihydrolipoamide acetyltransferase)